MRKFLRVWAFVGTQFIVSLPSFAQWESDRQITNYPGHHDYGSKNNTWTIAVQDTMVHIVWEHRYDNIGELYYTRSINSGSSFDPDTQLTTENSHFPSVAVRDSMIHVIWYDGRSPAGIYYKRSIDNGEIWGADEFLTNGGDPSIAICDSIVHIVCQVSGGIHYKRSVDNGMLWGADEILSFSGSYPSIAVCDSIVHVVYQDGGGIHYKRSIDNGVTWGADEFLTGGGYPSIATHDSIVHVVCQPGGGIHYKRSVDNGVTWGTDEILSFSGSRSSIAVCDSIVHVVWGSIHYRRSVDNGVTWGADETITNASAVFISVACWDCSYGYDVHIAWTDMRDGIEEIYYKRHKCPGSGIEEDKEFRVKSLELRVYPNPSFGNALIKYGLPEKASITLGLYDISGRLVKTIYSGTQEKGYHTINVGAYHDTPTGIYFIRLDTGDYKATRKLTIIR